MRDIGIGEQYEEYFITDYENDLDLKIGEYYPLSSLNEIAELISNLTDSDLYKLKAVIEHESAEMSDLSDYLDCLAEYTLYTNINKYEELGRYYIHEVGGYNIENMGKLANFIDYEAFARDLEIEIKGGFTSLGWLER